MLEDLTRSAGWERCGSIQQNCGFRGHEHFSDQGIISMKSVQKPLLQKKKKSVQKNKCISDSSCIRSINAHYGTSKWHGQLPTNRAEHPKQFSLRGLSISPKEGVAKAFSNPQEKEDSRLQEKGCSRGDILI